MHHFNQADHHEPSHIHIALPYRPRTGVVQMPGSQQDDEPAVAEVLLDDSAADTAS